MYSIQKVFDGRKTFVNFTCFLERSLKNIDAETEVSDCKQTCLKLIHWNYLYKHTAAFSSTQNSEVGSD